MNIRKGQGEEIHPKVCIIILNWNGLEDTIECLESLKRVTYPNYEVILVDNGSEGSDVDVLRETFGEYIQIIENDKNYGFAEGNNIGMRYALENSNPDYLLLLNNDTVVDPDCLTELVRVAESDPRIGVVGPKVCFFNNPNMIQSAGGQINWWSGQITLFGGGQIDRVQFNHIKDVDWVLGCALLVRSKTIVDMGLLYGGYFAYVEETDWCARCKKAGYRVVYVPRAKILHKRRLAIDHVDEFRLYYRTRNRFLFMKRNATGLQLVSFFGYFFLKDFLLTPVRLLVRQRDPKLLRSFYKGTYDGMSLILK